MAKYAAALDQGTTSSRAMVFNHEGRVESVAQKEHEQIYPKPGWVEHDPKEIWTRSQEVIKGALDKKNLKASDLARAGSRRADQNRLRLGRHGRRGRDRSTCLRRHQSILRRPQ